MPFSERKYRYGVDQVFEWVSPEPIEGTPDIAIYISGSTITGSMTSVHSGSISVTAIGDDRRKLTITEDVSTAGLQGRYGQAWLTTDTDGAYPVKITKISGSVVYLADILPREPSLTAYNTGSLQFSTFYYTLESGSATANIQRDVKWTIEYDSFYGSNTPDVDNNREEGLLHIVHQPFDTGLTHAMVAQHVQGLGDMVPFRQEDWSPQIQEAFDELIMNIRTELGTSYTEDNIPASTQFRLAHLSYVKAIILSPYDIEASDRFRLEGDNRLNKLLKKFWLDTNANNQVDSGEELTQVTGYRRNYNTVSRIEDTSGNVREYNKTWYPGSYH